MSIKNKYDNDLNTNQIDIEFKVLMEFIKENDLNQMKDIIKNNFSYISKNDRVNYLKITNFYNKIGLWGAIDLNNEVYELIDNNATALVEHREEFEWLYSHLYDYRSKKLLIVVLKYWLLLDFSKINSVKEQLYFQYFDMDLVKCDENEVFVDIGGYIGDTLISYSHVFGPKCYKSMYCYEIIPTNIEYIKKNIETFKLKNINIREKGVSNKSGKSFFATDEISSTNQLSDSGNFEVETVTIDEDIQEAITFIKMDIEGGEENALLGCKETILKNHPKLALSVYHNNDHLWKLAKIISDIDPSYKFYLRYYGGTLLPTEYLLYAI